MLIELYRNQILHGNVIDKLKEFPDESVHCIVTSPPYYGVRNYQTDPQIWLPINANNCKHEFVADNRKHNLGGCSVNSTLRDTPGQKAKEGWTKGASCEHEFGEDAIKRTRGSLHGENAVVGNTMSGISGISINTGGFCIHCGAWKGELGLEPTPELFVEHLVQIFRELRRVLRKDGTCWLNLGDSYCGSGVNDGKTNPGLSKARERNDVTSTSRPNTKVFGFKPKDLLMIPHRVAIALQQDGWWVRSDIVWCLSGGTWVYARTQKGDMPMTIKDMYRLKQDTVSLWNGEKWTKVLGWSKTKRTGKEIEIELRSGERISSTVNHEWPTQRGLIRTDELKKGDIIKQTILPEPENPKNPNNISNDAAWFVGLYLAEGSQSDGTIQIAGHLKEIERWKRCQQFVKSYGGYIFKYEDGGESKRATININSKIILAIIENFISGKTSKDKGLKTECWKYSNGFLEALLDGYLSGDGHWDEKNKRWRLGFSRNYNLEQSLRTLCARLGYRIKLKLGYAKNQNGKFPAFRGELRKETNRDHYNAKDYCEIISIRKARCRFVYDIAVEDEPHLFSLASGVLTHNSKKNPMPESVTDRPSKAHEYIFLLTKNTKYYYDSFAIRENGGSRDVDRERAINGEYKYEGKHKEGYGKATGRNDHLNKRATGQPIGDPIAGRNKRTVWEITTTPFAEAHFATFPEKLVEPCILAGTSEHGVCANCGKPYERILEREIRQVDKILRAESTTKFDTKNSTAGRLATYRQGERAYQTKYHVNEEGLFLNASKKSITTQSEREESKREAAELYPDDFGKQQWYINFIHEHGAVKRDRTIGWRKTCKCESNELKPAIILDPFFGAGTTGLVARRGNRDFVGIELNEKYIEIAKRRLAEELEPKLI